MSSRKKKKKRDQKKRHRAFKPGLRQPGFPDGGLVIVSPPGVRKMSVILMEFVKPYSEHWRTPEELQKVLTVAVVAWNAALLSGSQREELIQPIAEALPLELRPDFRASLEEMIQRKVSHFASDNRMILNFQVTMTGSKPQLSVVSTLPIG